jgi:cytochrome c oxidase cbb3-type subunit I/II
MPPYAHLLETPLDFAQISESVAAMRAVGVPYSEQTVADAATIARRQADEIAARVVAEAGPAGMADRKAVALVAYLMRLGTDLDKPVAPTPAAPAATASVASASKDAGSASGGGQ